MEALEARSQAAAELAGSDLESQFAALQGGDDVDDALAALKGKISGVQPSLSGTQAPPQLESSRNAAYDPELEELKRSIDKL